MNKSLIFIFFMVLFISLGCIQIIAAYRGSNKENKTFWVGVFDFYLSIYSIFGFKDRPYVRESLIANGVGAFIFAVIISIIYFVIG